MAMTSQGVWVAVESARDGGACVARRVVRVRPDAWNGVLYAEERNKSSAEWKPIAEPVAKRRNSHCCVAVGSLVYVLGGYDGVSSSPLDSVDVVDTVSGIWSTGPPMPEPIAAGHRCAAVGSLLYMIGGTPGFQLTPQDSVRVLDTVSGTWSTATPLPTPRYHHQCAVVGSLLYVVGGSVALGSSLDSVEVLDTASGTWSTAPPMSKQRSGHHCVVVGSLLYVVGGEGGFGMSPTSVEVLDTISGIWSNANLPEGEGMRPEELVCEYKEQPCARYKAGKHKE
eukprot:TRINITY_DN4317_c0_g2_i1.p1 TRINITY_DN4317_c0_g2~~TRINITY_DN4317_c0_g2_i1.p1  ORF type:complete len:282 (-),score=33.36 TRINITY_DN4317_c0_g2_i1:304-1149(-)